MKQIINKEWWIAAGTRAIKTICQTAVATIGTAALLEQVDWKLVISASILSGLLSILTSLAGLPEINKSSASKSTSSKTKTTKKSK